MRRYYITITPYCSVDGVIYRDVALLQVRRLPVRPHQQVFAPSPKSCSNDLTGGWRFNDCHNSNLNGQFMGNTKAYSGIGWVPFKHNLSLKFAEMKMRAQSFLKEKEDEMDK